MLIQTEQQLGARRSCIRTPDESPLTLQVVPVNSVPHILAFEIAGHSGSDFLLERAISSVQQFGEMRALGEIVGDISLKGRLVNTYRA